MTRQRRPRSTRVIAVLSTALVVGSLGTLLVSHLWSSNPLLDAAPAASASEPPWNEFAQRKVEYEARVSAPESSATLAASLLIAALRGGRNEGATHGSFDAEFDVSRCLRNGLEFACVVKLRVEESHGATQVVARIERSDKEVLRYEARVEGDVPVEVTVVSGDSRWTMADPSRFSGVPVSLGDIQVRDLSGLLTLIQGPGLRFLGTTSEAGSLELLVFGGELRTPDAPGTAREENASAELTDVPSAVDGASVMFYFQRASLALRRILVFDAADRLVRCYDDFDIRLADGQLATAAWRVDSIPDRSHSRYRLRSFERLGD